MMQVNYPKAKNKICYFIANLKKNKKVFPLFEVLIYWTKIQNERNKSSVLKIIILNRSFCHFNNLLIISSYFQKGLIINSIKR